MSRVRTIVLHAEAPIKPLWMAPCNGCGACCAAEPCPVSRLWLGHRLGPCPALVWRPTAQRYLCGMASAPEQHLRWLPSRWSELAARVFRRWIAAGRGCDFDATLEP